MSQDQFIPNAGADFRAACTDAMQRAGRLMSMLVEQLPDARQEALGALMAGGGRVGVELTVDRNGSPRIVLVGVEREGALLRLATVQTTEPAH